MLIYHGSVDLVDKPEIRMSGVFLDFGTGFYTTTSYNQAERWARNKMRRSNSPIGYVSTYDFDFELAKKNTTIRQFQSADLEWLTFIIKNRKGDSSSGIVDMHIGPVADDNVYRSIKLFEAGIYDADETLRKLNTEVLHDQWTFHTSKILSYCKFLVAKEISEVK